MDYHAWCPPFFYKPGPLWTAARGLSPSLWHAEYFPYVHSQSHNMLSLSPGVPYYTCTDLKTLQSLPQALPTYAVTQIPGPALSLWSGSAWHPSYHTPVALQTHLHVLSLISSLAHDSAPPCCHLALALPRPRPGSAPPHTCSPLASSPSTCAVTQPSALSVGAEAPPPVPLAAQSATCPRLFRRCPNGLCPALRPRAACPGKLLSPGASLPLALGSLSWNH